MSFYLVMILFILMIIISVQLQRRHVMEVSSHLYLLSEEVHQPSDVTREPIPHGTVCIGVPGG